MALWDRIERWLIGLLGAGALTIGSWDIFGRYISSTLAAPWANEVVVYLIIWSVFIAASQLVRSDGHVRPDLVLRLLPPGGQRIVEMGNCIVALAFCGGLFWYGWSVAVESYALDERSTTGLQFPMWIYYAALPVGGLLMTMRYALRLHRYAFHFDVATMTIHPGHAE
jgi:C4-dicarboxylate transporter DctQ subunit